MPPSSPVVFDVELLLVPGRTIPIKAPTTFHPLPVTLCAGLYTSRASYSQSYDGGAAVFAVVHNTVVLVYIYSAC